MPQRTLISRLNCDIVRQKDLYSKWIRQFYTDGCGYILQVSWTVVWYGLIAENGRGWNLNVQFQKKKETCRFGLGVGAAGRISVRQGRGYGLPSGSRTFLLWWRGWFWDLTDLICECGFIRRIFLPMEDHGGDGRERRKCGWNAESFGQNLRDIISITYKTQKNIKWY